MRELASTPQRIRRSKHACTINTAVAFSPDGFRRDDHGVELALERTDERWVMVGFFQCVMIAWLFRHQISSAMPVSTIGFMNWKNVCHSRMTLTEESLMRMTYHELAYL